MAGSLVRFPNISDTTYERFRNALSLLEKKLILPNCSYRTADGRGCLVPPIRYTTKEIKRVSLKLRISEKAFQRLKHGYIHLNQVIIRASNPICYPEEWKHDEDLDIYLSKSGIHEIGTYCSHKVAAIVKALKLWKNDVEEWIVL